MISGILQARTREHLLYLFDQRSHVEAGEGGLLGRLQDHRVPAAESRPQLPRRHHQGEVPLRKNTEHGNASNVIFDRMTIPPLCSFRAAYTIVPKAADSLERLRCAVKEVLLHACGNFKCHLFNEPEAEVLPVQVVYIQDDLRWSAFYYSFFSLASVFTKFSNKKLTEAR